MSDIELLAFGFCTAFFVVVLKSIVQTLVESWSKKEWVELTDEDKQKLAAEHHDWESLCFAVQAKLKEKNNAT